MQYHVILTERCNLSCSYCGGTRHLADLPLDPVYSAEDLDRFISKDGSAIVGFYGGEPLLAIGFMEEVMDKVRANAFTLQTNGTGLSALKDRYLHRLHSMLVSLDGGEEATDRCRGAGTYRRVISNLKDVRDRGYAGDVIARMAISKEADLYSDVMHLVDLRDPHFDHVHWQLDMFWSDLDTWTDVRGWLDRYDEGITDLIEGFERSFATGRPLPLVPFLPIMDTLISGQPRDRIWCGSGTDSFSIMTDGSVHVCPIAPELPYSKVGDIRTSGPEDLSGVLPVGPPCTECDIKGVCGGRCLYSNKVMPWGRDLFDRVCMSTRCMIDGLRGIVPVARELIAKGALPADVFRYPTINNGCEIIP